MRLVKRLIPLLLPVLLAGSAALTASGCGGGAPFTRTVYVPDGTPVRLRETVKDVRVWVKDADGQVVAGRMDLYEGWFALPLESETE